MRASLGLGLLLLSATTAVACSEVGPPAPVGPAALRFALNLWEEPTALPEPDRALVPSPAPAGPEAPPPQPPAPAPSLAPGAAGGGGGGGGAAPVNPSLALGFAVSPGGFSDPVLAERASSAP